MGLTLIAATQCVKLAYIGKQFTAPQDTIGVVLLSGAAITSMAACVCIAAIALGY